MLTRLRSHRPQHGTVVAYLALFVALGGTTYAAATIGAADIKDDAVRSNHIKNGTVKNSDLGANSVATGKVADGSLTGADVKPDSVGGAKILESSLGKVPLAAYATNGLRAYAHVQDDGTLDAARSKNVLDVRPVCYDPCDPLPPHQANANQCFKLAFVPSVTVGIAEIDSTATVVRTRTPGLAPFSVLQGCPPGYRAAQAQTLNDSGEFETADFSVAFF